MVRKRVRGESCVGCGTETACALKDGDRKVPLCPECLGRVRFEPGAREILLAEGPTRPN